jgi:hypothetical protein
MGPARSRPPTSPAIGHFLPGMMCGFSTTDRFFRRSDRLNVANGRPQLEFDPTKLVKRTPDIEFK